MGAARTRRTAPSRRISTPHSTPALLLARVEQGDSNLVITLFTEKLGKVSALARNARNSRRRFGGSLEPLHTLSVELDESGGDLLVLKDASLLVARTALIEHLAALQAAGLALRWVKHAAPARTAEPMVWALLVDLLDALNQKGPRTDARLLLAECGLRLLSALGWGLELSRCVRCGRPCPSEKRAYISPTQGGLMCRQCGVAKTVLPAATRARMARAAEGESRALEPSDCDLVLDLTEQCLAAHTSFKDN